MQRLSTTVLGVIGPGSGACVRSLADAANVTALALDDDIGADERARRAWERATRSHARYTVHDADPLQSVADAWVESFSGQRRGELEVRVADAVAAWRARSIGLPDYYLIIEPDELQTGRKDWYLGVLHRAAPHRVVPVTADGAAVRRAINRLEAGRWWPELPELLDDLERLLPDQVMTTDDAVPGQTLRP